MTRSFTTTKPPPVELLAQRYFTGLMSIPVTTRIPQPTPGMDTITKFLRVESAGGAQLVQSGQEGYFWNCGVLVHSYAPDNEEVDAEDNCGTALGWGANAQGTWITTKKGARWYCSFSQAPGLAKRLEDPLVPLTRYRGLIMWRFTGLPLG